MTGDRPHTTAVDDLEAGEIRFLGDVQRLTLAPGDILVLKSPHPISAEMAERIRDMTTRVLGEERRVIILDAGFELGVLSPIPCTEG